MNEEKQNALAGLIAYIIFNIRQGEKPFSTMQEELKGYIAVLEKDPE